MKKLFVFTLALFLTANAFAQTQEEMELIKEGLTKVTKLLNLPKITKLSGIDELAQKCKDIADNSVEITPLLENLYYSSIGENNDGVADVSVKKPTLSEAIELSKRISNQTKFIKDAGELLPGAADEIKSIKNPLQIKNATSSLKYSKDVLATTGEQTILQAKAIANIIQTLSK